jgi:hypothetical protein
MSDAGLVTLSGQVQTLDGQVVGAAQGVFRSGSHCAPSFPPTPAVAGEALADCLWYETTMERWAQEREARGTPPSPELAVLS